MPLPSSATSATRPEPVLVPPAGGSDGLVTEFLAAARPLEVRRPLDGVLRLDSVRFDGVDASRRQHHGVLRRRRGRPMLGPSDLLSPSWGSPLRFRRRHFDRTVLILEIRSRAAENYFHWHVDALANIWLHRVAVRAAEREGRQSPLLAAPIGPSAWQRESLLLSGIDRSEIIPIDSVGDFDAPEFLVPVRPFGSREVPGWIVRALRSLAVVRTEAPTVGDGASGPRLLHVLREGTGRRRVRGEEALSRSLDSLGFVALSPSRVSVADQRRIFSEADVIVAAHGAALTNLAWARPGAVVLELLSLARPNLVFQKLATQAGLRHVGVLCHPAGSPSDPHGDIVADRDLILGALEVLMRRSSSPRDG